MLTANLSEIQQEQGRLKDVYYKFTMNLRDLKSGRLIWADEKKSASKRPVPSSEADHEKILIAFSIAALLAGSAGPRPP